MDYLFFNSLKDTKLLNIVVSYDIACQWSKNLWRWLTTYPDDLHLEHDIIDFKFVVPNFHLPVHIKKCQMSYSLNLEVGVGRTNGEGPECSWANSNCITSSSKEMGPGMQRDTLDDHFGDWNWKKVVVMGELPSHGPCSCCSP